MDGVLIRRIKPDPAAGGLLQPVPTCLAIVLTAALLAGCGKAPPISPADPVPVDLQSVSSWNPELAGTALGEAIGTAGTFDECMGFIDAAADLGDPVQTRVEGWAWNTAASEAFEAFVVTDREGLITGAGITVVERADVKAAFPDSVRDSLVGFVAFSAPDAQRLTVYGINRANDSVCAVGSIG